MTAASFDEIPVYLRLRGMLAIQIIEGRYREGDQLPSVRAFAAETGTNPLTVAKAYQTLQDDGHVVVRRGIGMFVAPGAVDALKVQEREIFLTRIWPRMRALIDRLDIDVSTLMDRETA
ncbi:MAG: GntR family transcriptional regulator [Alphaproteobacteria bacterium]|nr:GntR family transcriptional regulator [Alphaproteobacteria bacterium]